MRSKKTAALVLSSAMLFTAMLGLAGCRDKDKDKDKENPSTADRLTPKDPAEQGVTLRADERVKAYVAYKPDGTEIGKYTTLAAAINAAVDEDADTEVFGSYVTKVDGTRHLFTNRAGFTSENSDMFWYYQDGAKLDQMFCWDNVNSIQILQNTDYIVHEVSAFGKKSMQTWNSYGLLDLNGNRIDKEKQSAQSWELSSTMDAGMIAFPKRLSGITKQVYNIDLSNVRITPPYQGGDPVYAFMGFYSWQDYYVVDLGIACDVTTGNWYPFEATSRDDSFSDANYEIDTENGCLMTSTWDKAGGYFVPDMASISMSIETQLLSDPDYPEDVYQSNYLVVKDKDGKVMYERRLEADALSNFFPSANMGKENTYIFNAGLDIKNANALSDGVHVKNVDYFNGAKFENLTITEATAYFPTVEEMSDTAYGAGGIDADLRGNTYSILLADNMKDTPETGVFDYVVLNNNLCSSYEAKDGCDVYSFSFDRVPVADDEFGTNLKSYQDQIDALKGLTMGEIADKIADIEAIRDNIYLKEKELQKFHGLLDFTPFEEANNLLLEAMKLSDAGKAVAEDFKKLGNILDYDIKGLATDGEEIAGYLYNEIEKFKTIKAAYGALGAEDQERIFFHIEKAKFDKWDTLATELPATIAQAEAVTAKIMLGAKNTTAVKDWTEQTAKYALDELVYWSIAMKFGTVWGEGENDDPNNAKVKVMNFDNNTYPSIRIILCRQFLEANKVTMPSYLEETFEAIKYDDFYEGAYYPIYGTVQAAMKIRNNEWLNDEDLETFLNDVWAPDYTLSGQIAWNWNSGAKFEDYYSVRTRYIASIAGGTLKDGENAYKTYQYFEVVANFLQDTLGFTVKANGWGIEEGTIDLGGDESAAALAVAGKMNALSALGTAYEVKGWTAPDGAESVAGYYYSEILSYRSVLEELNALSVRERFAALGKADAEKWAAWGKESEALATLMADEKYTATTSVIKLADTPTGTTYTDRNPEYALKQLTYWASRIARGTEFGEDENSWSDNKGHITVCNWDDTAYPSIRVAVLENFLQSDLKLTLTPYMQEVLKAIKSREFYNDYYYIVANTTTLAKSITDGNKTKITDLTADELEFVKAYFTSEYTGTLKSGFASFNEYQSVRSINGIVKYVGAEIEGKTDIKGYFDVVTNFLVEIGYTADAQWGVTESILLDGDIAKDELQVINLIYGINDISSNASVVKGWKTEGAAIKGYLGNELENYRKFKVELAKLDETKQAAVKERFGDAMLKAWDKFDEEMTALQADDALKNLEIKAVKVSGAMRTFTGEEAMAELLAVLTTISRGELYVTNDDANGGKVATMTSDNQFMPSFYACFLVEKFNEADVKLPTVIDDLLVQVAYKDSKGVLSAFVKDFKYIYNVASLAEKIENSTASKNAVVSVVNGYMKGFTKFAEGGFHWNFNASGGKDFLYRSKSYVNYFGFGPKKVDGKDVPAKTLAEIIKIVTDTLQDVELVKYGDENTAYDVKVGVAADITVDNVKGDMPEGDPAPVDPTPELPDPIIDIKEDLLPETEWTTDEGATDGKTVTATKEADGGWKFEANSANSDWSYAYKNSLTDVKMTRDSVLVYDLTAGGASEILFYVLDTNAGDAKNQYVHLGGIIATKNALNGSLKGEITLQDMLDYLVDVRKDTTFSKTDNELNIRMIRVYLNAGQTLTIKQLAIGEKSDLLPETADGWNKDNMADNATVTIVDGASKIDATAHTGDLEYSANIVVNKTISVANGAIAYDLATAGGACDIVIYVTEGPNGANGTGSGGHYVYFSNFGLTTDSFTGKGVITGEQLLAAVKAKSDSKNWGYTGEETELTIVEFRVRSGAGSVLTINELYLTTATE